MFSKEFGDDRMQYVVLEDSHPGSLTFGKPAALFRYKDGVLYQFWNRTVTGWQDDEYLLWNMSGLGGSGDKYEKITKAQAIEIVNVWGGEWQA